MDFTTGYAQLGDDRIAYQVIGEGPVDVVLTVGWWGSFDVEWEDTALRAFYKQMASYARVIRFDRRGTGASDSIPLDALPPWESFALEIECVMDAVGSDQAAIIAAGGAGPAGMFFAATRPDRVRALVLYQTTARYLEDDDDREDGPIFLNNAGDRMDRHHAARVVRRLAKRAGIDKNISLNSLRHSFVTVALDAGVPLRDVQEAASHADPRTTKRYDRARTLPGPARHLHSGDVRRWSQSITHKPPRNGSRQDKVRDVYYDLFGLPA